MRRDDNIDSQAYAIDAELMNKGRRFALTKRRVRFCFGFGSKRALESGECGQSCRGEEHQVVLIWSLTSGKQRVLADGIEVHFARCGFTDNLDCQWTMKNGHIIRVIGRRGLKGDISKFDLIIDGLSYWKMPQIYQLGGLREVKPVRRRTLLPEDIIPSITSTGSTESAPHSPVVPTTTRPQAYQRAISAPATSHQQAPSPTTVLMDVSVGPTTNTVVPKNPLNHLMSVEEVKDDMDLPSSSSSLSLFQRPRLPSDFSTQSEHQPPTMFRINSTSDLSVQSACDDYPTSSSNRKDYSNLLDWSTPPRVVSRPIYSMAR